jgi:hypothetical protein
LRRRWHPAERRHGGAVSVAYPQPVVGGAPGGLDDGRRACLPQRLLYGVRRAGLKREQDIVQPLDPRCQEPDLHKLRPVPWATTDPSFFPAFQATVPPESFCEYRSVAFQRAVLQPEITDSLELHTV